MAFSKNKKKNFSFDSAVNSKTLHKHLEFTATEQYKLLRANLSFMLHEDEKCSVIGITSSMRGEGKSTTAINLAYVLAEDGKKVLLIDGDLRIPSIAKKMKINNSPGLTNALMSKDAESLKYYRTSILDNWYILPSGDLPPNPSELLGSGRMEKIVQALSNEFDCIIIDLPPLNIVSDALAVSKFISGMVVVVREDYTEKKELENCFRQLELSNVNILGCVLNGADKGKSSYGKYKKYYNYYGDYKSGEQPND